MLDMSDPVNPAKIDTLTVADIAADAVVNSVAVANGLVAVAVESNPKTDPGYVAVFGAADLQLRDSIQVGAQPDMVTFTPDGWKRLERAAERIVEMDAFAEASTIADADFIESIDEMLVVEPYRGAVENQTKSLSELRRTAQGDQFLRGSLVSDDLKSVMMVLAEAMRVMPAAALPITSVSSR